MATGIRMGCRCVPGTKTTPSCASHLCCPETVVSWVAVQTQMRTTASGLCWTKRWTNLATHTFDGCGPAVLGCTNANTLNYNSDATGRWQCEFDNVQCGCGCEESQYNPANLSIEPGQTVVWSNLGGTHDVNGDIDPNGASFGNPEFSLLL